MKMSKTKAKPILAWAGFVDGGLDFGGWPLGNGTTLPVAAIFRNKAEARKRYQDVRRIRITVK
jgi:hypothetical protein